MGVDPGDFHMIALAYPPNHVLDGSSGQLLLPELVRAPGGDRHRKAVSQRVPGNLQRDPLEVSGDGVQGDTREADLRERWTGRRFQGGDPQDTALEAAQGLGEESAGRDCPAAGSRLRSTTVFDRRATCSRSNRGSGSHALALLDDNCHLFR